MSSNNLELQLSETEMLQSMFPDEGEFKWDDPLAEDNARQWISATNQQGLNFDPPTLSYSITLQENKDKLEVHVSLGRDYPESDKPEVYLKSSRFSRESQARINADLATEMAKLEQGELAVMVVVCWLQEHWLAYLTKDTVQVESPKNISGKPKDVTFTRLWIYSHHIYSKTKRKDLLDLSSDFNLTGFSMPGKPGIICLEGYARDCVDAWGVIKSWNWKKINVKIQEDTDLEGNDVDGFRRFKDFQEIGFVKNSDSRDYHMDMGEFYNYLKSHESDYMFKEFFGITKDGS